MGERRQRRRQYQPRLRHERGFSQRRVEEETEGTFQQSGVAVASGMATGWGGAVAHTGHRVDHLFHWRSWKEGGRRGGKVDF